MIEHCVLAITNDYRTMCSIFNYCADTLCSIAAPLQATVSPRVHASFSRDQ